MRTGETDQTGAPAEPEMVDARLHLAAIVDSSHDAIISKDMNGIIKTWNASAARVFGYEANEIIGQSVRRLIPPELQHEEDEILSRLRAGERIDHYETIRMRKNGQRFPASLTISPIRDVAGKVIGVSKIARDISDRITNDETRFRLATIVDSADDAIISKDLNGIVRTWNRGAARIFGYSAEEMIGQSILRLIPEDLHYEEDEILKRLRAGERIEHYETKRRRKDGTFVDVSVTISPIQDESGHVIGASKIARDISDRKQVERRLVEAEKLAVTGRMAAAIAHEINNPLESVINLVFLARQSCFAGGEGYDYLLTAEQELERVSHIARQTLGYYRDTGSPAEVHIQELVENVLVVNRAKILANKILVQTEFNDLQKIRLSKGEMIQVLSNVIANAIDAMRRDGVLHISTSKIPCNGASGIKIVVQDNGTGITAANLERVFEPFYSTKGNLGTGIGLWMAKQLVEKRGGQISVASTTGKGTNGTTVIISIPYELPTPAQSAPRQE